MSHGEPARPRWIDVAPERFPGWIEAFGQRHGALAAETKPAAGTEPAAGTQTAAEATPRAHHPPRADAGPAAGICPGVVVVRAADGAVAVCHPPFPPLPPLAAGPDQAAAGLAELVADHAGADRTVGVLLVRLGGYAAGVFAGVPPRLADSKVGSRLVHGRSAAGGQSQQRFARRREKQAAEALSAAGDTAAAVFGRSAGQLDAVVLGGDRRAMAALRDDPRLAGYFRIAVERFLTVPDPRLAVLMQAPRMFRAIRIQLTEP